jgi:hypothetical protein
MKSIKKKILNRLGPEPSTPKQSYPSRLDLTYGCHTQVFGYDIVARSKALENHATMQIVTNPIILVEFIRLNCNLLGLCVSELGGQFVTSGAFFSLLLPLK